jgi:methyltransferase (TIGR00027 family)
MDSEKDELMSKLDESGYRHDLKTLFIWEGVCKYLSSEAVDEVLSIVANQSCSGSSIVFDYLFQSMINGRSGSPLARKVLDFQTKKGEPFIFGLPEENPEGYIKAKGFAMVRNAPAAEIKKVLFNNSARTAKLHPFWGIIHATV